MAEHELPQLPRRSSAAAPRSARPRGALDVGQRAGGRRSAAPVLLERLEHDRLEVAAQRAVDRGWAGRARSRVMRRTASGSGSPRRRAAGAGEQLVQDDAQRVDVGARSDARGSPRACSGLMYGSVPKLRPGSVRRVATRAVRRRAVRARPKSSTLTPARRAASTSMFDGLRSRWTTPLAVRVLDGASQMCTNSSRRCARAGAARARVLGERPPAHELHREPVARRSARRRRPRRCARCRGAPAAPRLSASRSEAAHGSAIGRARRRARP